MERLAPPPGEGPLELHADTQQAGQRLDRFVTAVVPGLSRSLIQRLIKEGRIRVGGRAARPSALVRAGELVTIDVPASRPAAPAPEPIDLDVIYEDADLAVVHPAAGHAGGTLVNALLHRLTGLSGIGGVERPGIVHRLDRGTSGLMVVAKHDASHRELARQFHEREVEKRYVALVWGLVHAGRRIDAAIGRDPVQRQRMSTRARRARTAVTRVTGAEPLGGVTLVEVSIATGRTHQVRVHLSAIGHPIVGDAVYGGVRRRVPPDLRAVTRLERPFLHASRLAFTHPGDGSRLEFESPVPEDLRSVVEELRARRAGAP